MSLKLTDINKNFGEKSVLKNFSYEFRDKGVYALVGESGKGKTTLLRIIAGLDKDYTGEVLGGGIGKVSFSFQEYRLFPKISAIDNIVFSAFDRKGEAEYKKAEKMLFDLGFNERDIFLSSDQLSGGMKQRVSLARAILFDKPILLLDEPTKELDEKNSDAVLNMILEISKTRLVILVTHNLSDAETLGATIVEIGS